MHYIHETVKAENGLPQNTVSAITQTSDGFIWMATQEGLARYDGVQFRTYDQANTPVMKSNFITSLAAARDGSLWVGSWHGGVLRLSGNVATALVHNKELYTFSITSLLESADDTLWIGTDHGLYVNSHSEWKKLGPGEGLPDEEISNMVEDSSGSIWIRFGEGRVARWNGRRMEPITTQDGLPDNRTWGLSLAPDGSVWVGSGRFLCRFSDSGLTQVSLEIPKLENPVRTFLSAGDQGFWIGVQNQGLWHQQDGVVSDYSTDDGLSNDIVISLLKDREGIIWAGTAGGGVNRFHRRKITTYTMTDGLAHNVLWTVYQGSEGSIWIGTNGGGVSRLKEGKFINYGKAEGLSSLISTSICETMDGTVWIGTGDSGIYHLKNGRIQPFLLGSTPQEKTIWAIHAGRDGTVWVGTANGLFQITAGKVRKLTTQDGLAGDSVRGFSETADGTLWLATDGGLSRILHGRIDAWSNGQGLPTNFVLCVYAENSGDVWMGTRSNGLILFHKNKFTPITSREGLFNDYVYQIIDDEQGRLWMSCNRGIFHLPKEQALALAQGSATRVNCRSFGTDDGMNNPECNGGRYPAGSKLRSGQICFPTMEGLACVDPSTASDNAKPPPLHLERVVMDKRALPIGDEITVPPGKRELEFYYHALSLVNPRKVLYQYRLDPYDSDWVQAGNRREAFYTNIPPGNYTFRFRAGNNDGVWNNNDVTFSFRLQPHFYETIWFYACCGFALIGLIALAVNLRVRRMTVQQRRLESLVAERTRQLQEALEKVEELANTDGLTGVANRRCFEEWMLREWKRSARALNDLSVIMIDIDYFKLYNDTHGHLAGDECLKQVAQAIRVNNLRASDLAGRYGGEEFILILPATVREGAQQVADKIRLAVECLRIPHGNSPISDFVTVSIGVASAIPQYDLDYHQLIASADRQLYRAKQSGRNRVCTE